MAQAFSEVPSLGFQCFPLGAQGRGTELAVAMPPFIVYFVPGPVLGTLHVCHSIKGTL